MRRGALVLFFASLVAGCASDAPMSAATTTSPLKSVPASATAATPVATPAAAPARTTTTSNSTVATAAAASDASAAPICRRVEVLGSRVRKTRVCKTRGEWEQIEQQKDETFRRIDRGASGAGADPALGGG
jgi:hypothetical protein